MEAVRAVREAAQRQLLHPVRGELYRQRGCRRRVVGESRRHSYEARLQL
ncbi:MAG: hypothetical protein O4805_14570 [Trichodesmium sp. St16_bin2-tuft]|nr:hypothetical protein [Trichodesmium sp. St16_bin2-tuft]